MLPVLAVVSWLGWSVARQRFDGERDAVHAREIGHDEEVDAPVRAEAEADEIGSVSSVPDGSDNEAPALQPVLFEFDPNTVEYHDLVRLGFSRGEALGIVKYRERGKVFEIPEDFAACYQVSEEMYLRLRHYIKIGEQFRLKKFERQTGFRQNGADVAPTEGVSEGIVQSVQPRTGTEEVRQVSAFHENPLVELNSADSAALISVRGIGPATLGRIMEYRRRLGGFARVEQLAEVAGVTEQNYERIVKQIFVDTLAIQKIDINFADAKLLGGHPYIDNEQLRKLLKLRQLKGGWNNTGQLIDDKIFTPAEAERLAPYLLFGKSPQ